MHLVRNKTPLILKNACAKEMEHQLGSKTKLNVEMEKLVQLAITLKVHVPTSVHQANSQLMTHAKFALQKTLKVVIQMELFAMMIQNLRAKLAH